MPGEKVDRAGRRASALRIGGVLLLLTGALSAQPVPTASLNAPAQVPIGSAFGFTAAFDNISAAATGYGPFIDLFLPAIGTDGAGAAVDDGITFSSATYLGAPVTATVLTFNGAGQATHPYARNAAGNFVVVAGTPGNQLVVLLLPFGSFTPSQPPAPVTVNALLSNLADLSTPLTIQARGGFRFGADPLDNPTSGDPSILGGIVNAAVTPTLLTLSKAYVGPEDETATGPNFPRQYTVAVSIAPGQTLTNLDVSDFLPNSLAFLSVVSTSPGGAVVLDTPTVGAAANPPNNDLVVRFPSVTGPTSATVTFDYFVPQFDANGNPVLSPASGDDATSVDDARAQGNWTPVDTRDPPTLATSNVSPNDHTLTDKSLAIQKSVSVAIDTGAAGPTPGDTLQYSLSFQISDFFAFQNLVVSDVISDGQRNDPGFTPTLSLTEHGTTSSGNMTGANFSFVVDSPGTGNTNATFQVSDELVTRGLDAQVLGGCVPSGGTGGPPPNCVAFNGGGATGTIVFRTVIQENFTDTFPSGDPSVDQGDVLTDAVTATGDLLSTANLVPLGTNESDTSSASVTIVGPSLAKSIYAVNGSTSFPMPVRVGPGDTVTYRIRYTLPTSDFENLSFTDFLPLPIFDATTILPPFVTVVSAVPPPSGQAKFGPADTFFPLSGVVPTISSDAVSNSVVFGYGTFDNPASASSEIDILFTVTVSNQPFADGLFLTNQVRATEGTTNAGTSTDDEIIQIQLTEPNVIIRKGVVATDNPGGVFAPAAAGPVAFTPPGSLGYRGAGTIHSNGLAGTPINSNLSQVDAGDLVTFAIVLENTGSGINGAFDVRVRDTIPAGFSIPAGLPGLNFTVTDGTGAPMPFLPIGTGLFDPAGGIELIDPGPTNPDPGALDRSDPTNGRNIAVLTYDLLLDAIVAPAQALTNTATLFSLANTEGGPNFVPGGVTDTAVVTIVSPAPAKSVAATSEAHTGFVGGVTRVAIGEIARYRLVARIGEGSAVNLQLQDQLPVGLQFFNDNTARVAFVSNGPGLSSSTLSGVGLSVIGNETTVASVTPSFILPDAAVSDNQLTNSDVYGSSTDPFFKLGNVVNDDRDADQEFVVVEFNALVLNLGSNGAGVNRDNTFTLRVNLAQAGPASNSLQVRVQEPAITNVNKVVQNPPSATGDAGDTIAYRTTYSNAAGANNTTGFEARLTDPLPASLTLNPASVTVTLGGGAAGVTNASAGNTVDVEIAVVPAGGTVQVDYTATVASGVSPGQLITNTASLVYTSLPGSNGTVVNATGSSTPGAPGSGTGERNGVGTDLNDLFDSDPATLTIVSTQVAKALTATNQPSTSGVNVAIGEILTYQVTATIPEGVSSAVTLTDTLDPGLAFVDCISVVPSSGALVSTIGFPAACNDPINPVVGLGGQTAAYNLGTVTNSDPDNAVAETIVFTYTAVVTNTPGNDRGVLRNNSAALATSGTLVTASAPNVVVAEPTLQVVKTASPATGGSGDVITFTLTVSHAGASNADAFEVDFSDTVPAGLTYVAGSFSNTAGLAPTTLSDSGSPTLTASWASFPLGSTSTLRFQAAIDATVTPGQTITNTADLAWTGLPGDVTAPQSPYNPVSTERTGNPSNPGGAENDYRTSGSGAVTASPRADLSVTKTDVPDPVLAGGDITYNLTVANGGPSVASNAVLTDPIPGGTTFQSLGAPAGWTCLTPVVGGTGNISCSNPSFPIGSVGFAVVVRVALATPPGTVISNTVSITSDTADPNPGDNSDTEPTTVAVPGQTDLAVVKTDSPDPVATGSNVTYTLAVSNNGPAAATGVLVTDTLPGGVIFVSASPGCSEAGGVVTCAVGSLANGSSINLTITITAPVAGTITNTASVTGNESDPNPTNNSDSEPTTVAGAAQADLSIVKSDSPDPVAAGSNVTYTLIVTNNGPANATGVTVTDTLPGGVTFASASPGCSEASGVVTCAVGSLAASSNVVLSIVGTTTVAGTITNTASVAGSEGDPNPTNNSDSENTLVSGAAQADLSLTKADSPDPAALGGTLNYALVVTNNGPASAPAVTLTDNLPPGVTFVSATPSQGACGVGNPVVCNLGTIPAGGNATVAIAVTPTASGVVVNNASVTSTAPDPDPANNAASASTTVLIPDLTIAKSHPIPFIRGAGATYNLSVSNLGPVATFGTVTVTDTLPAGLMILFANGFGWSCLVAGQTVTCDRSDALPAGAVYQAIQINVTVLETAPASFINTATVSGGGDASPGNNTSSDPTDVGSSADLAITKGGPGGVVPGTNLVYTIAVNNFGPSDALGVVVNDPTPPGLAFVSNSGDCTTPFPCALGALPAGQGRTITTTFAVPSGYTAPNPILNTGSVTSSTPDPDGSNNSDSESTPLAASSADLAITKTDGVATATPGGAVTYTIVASNNGPSDVTGAPVTDTFPSTIVSASWTCTASPGSSCAASGTGPIATSVNLLVTGTATFTVTANIASSATGNLVNTASVNTPPGVGDSNASNNSATDIDTLAPSADCSLVKTGPAGVAPGSNLVYTIVMTNAGPSDAASVTVSDPTPAGLTFVSNSGSCITPYPCSLGTIPAGASRTVTTTYAVPSGYTAPDPILNTATVASSTPDPNSGNNSDQESTPLTAPSADLAVTKTGPAAYTTGSNITFSITIVNNGPVAATGVTLTDPLPAGVTFVSATPSQGACSGTTTVTCVLGTLTNGASATVSIVVTANTTGTIINAANVSGNETDPNFANNASTSISAGGSAADIPTLSEWGMLVMLLLLAGLGYGFARRSS